MHRTTLDTDSFFFFKPPTASSPPMIAIVTTVVFGPNFSCPQLQLRQWSYLVNICFYFKSCKPFLYVYMFFYIVRGDSSQSLKTIRIVFHSMLPLVSADSSRHFIALPSYTAFDCGKRQEAELCLYSLTFVVRTSTETKIDLKGRRASREGSLNSLIQALDKLTGSTDCF